MLYNSTHEPATYNNIITIANNFESIICLNKIVNVTERANAQFTNATHCSS